MAATNYTPIQLYYSTTASAAPTAINLTSGELAINITDGKLYYKDNGGVVQVLATKGAGTIGGSTTQIQYNNAGSLAGNAAMTFNSGTSTTTLTTLNLTNALGSAYGGTAQSAYTQGDFLYASATNTLSKLAIGTVNYILTSTGSVPQWVAPTSVTVNTATNIAGGAAGSVPYQSGVATTTFLAIGAANTVMTSSGTAPQWGTTLTGLTGLSSSSITNTSLTSGRVVYSGASGVETDSASLTFNGTTLSAGGFSTTGLSTLVKTVTIGDSNFNGAAVFAAATPAKLYMGTGTVTDVTSAASATNTTGAIASLAITPIAATNTAVTYTNASTLYIAGAPSASTNVTITNPYSLYVAAGASYFGGAVTFASSIGALTVSSLTDSGLTSGRVTYAGTGGLLQDSTNLTFNGTTLTANTIGAFTLGGTIAGGGNQINNVIIGATTPLAGAFTTLSATGTITASNVTALTVPNGYQTLYRTTNDASSLAHLLFYRGSGAGAFAGIYTIGDAANGVASLNLNINGTDIAKASSTGLAVTGTLSTTGALTVNTTALVSSGTNNIGINTASPLTNGATYGTLTINGSNGGAIQFATAGTSIAQVYNDGNALFINPSSGKTLSLQIASSTIASVSSTGLAVTGTLSSTLAITTGTDVKVADGGYIYSPTGSASGTVKAGIQLNGSGNITSKISDVTVTNITSTGLAVTGTLSATGAATFSSTLDVTGEVQQGGSVTHLLSVGTLAYELRGNGTGSETVYGNSTGTGKLSVGYLQGNDKSYVYSAAPTLVLAAGNVETVNVTSTGLAVTGTLSSTLGATIQGLTVGRGAGAVSTNTTVGASAFANNSSGSSNAAFGFNALYTNGIGAFNSGFGQEALYFNSSGYSNSAFGYYALRNNTGQYNTAVGDSALASNTTASNSTAVGYQAGYSNITGAQNVFLGLQAGYTSTNGYNTFIGSQAGYGVTTGIQNTFIGGTNGATGSAGSLVTTGSKNTIIGCYTGNQGGLDIRTGSNYVVISDGDGNPRAFCNGSGYWVFGGSSNIGSAQNSIFYTPGTTFGLGFKPSTNSNTPKPCSFLETGGAEVGSITTSGSATLYNVTSDYRLKTVIGAVADSGSRIDALQPVEYTWKADGSRTRGFLAHQFQEVYADSVTGTKDAVDAEGKPVYQAMQASTSEVIADLVAEIQSLRKRLAAAGI